MIIIHIFQIIFLYDIIIFVVEVMHSVFLFYFPD